MQQTEKQKRLAPRFPHYPDQACPKPMDGLLLFSSTVVALTEGKTP